MSPAKKKSFKHFEFLKSLGKNEANPLYIIYGEEYFLREKILSYITKTFMTEGAEDFDIITLHGNENIATEAVENLEMTPFIGKYKIVIIKEFGKLKANEKNDIAEYCQDCSPQSILILVTSKIDKRKSAEKKLMSKGISIECKKPYSSRDLISWIKIELQTQNINMDYDAVNLFANSLDLDYMLAKNELEKLVIYNNGKKSINIEDVRACTGKSKANKIFDLQNALGNKNLKNSINITENMLSNRESAIFIIVMLTRFFTVLWKIQALKQRGFNNSEISSNHLNEVFYSFRGDYIRQASNFKIMEVRKIFNLLLQADIDLKSLNLKENILLEILLYKICKIG